MAVNITLNATNATAILGTQTSHVFGELKPLILLTIGIFIYSFFIFKFYRFLADKDIIKRHWHKKYEWRESFLTTFMKGIFYTLEYLIIAPIAVFFWFFVLAGLLLLLSSNTPSQIMLVSMAIIGAIRIAAHYNSDLSKDLAKMIPFAFLGVYVIDMHAIPLSELVTKGLEFLSMIDTMLFFLLFIVVLESILRIIHFIFKIIGLKKESNKE
ncbi:hypothetical protein JXA48_04830 [Candidatus Woesearchaeota archaeon]|nr:hypothetical protein [Candidatus Woesearchaeota archaeon]